MKKTRPELPSLKNSNVSAFKEFPETIVEGEKQHFGVGLIFGCQSQTQNKRMHRTNFRPVQQKISDAKA